MHEDPQVPNYGKRGYGTLLKKGMCIAIEPMITLGSRQIVMERDGWTVRTRDRKCAAHFEHTVAIGVGKADILSSFEYVEYTINCLWSEIYFGMRRHIIQKKRQW